MIYAKLGVMKGNALLVIKAIDWIMVFAMFKFQTILIASSIIAKEGVRGVLTDIS